MISAWKIGILAYAILTLPVAAWAQQEDTKTQSVSISGKAISDKTIERSTLNKVLPWDCIAEPLRLWADSGTPGPQSYMCELLKDREILSDPIRSLTSADPAFGLNASTAGASCGNPTVLSSGNKIETVVDYRAAGPFPLEIVRKFNSNSGMGGMFGWLWMSRFDMKMVTYWLDDLSSWDESLGYYTNQIEDTRLYRDDGSTIALKPVSNGYEIIGQSPTVAKVVSTGFAEITYFKSDGGKEIYIYGNLAKVIDPQGVTWTLTYSAGYYSHGYLIKVTHSNGKYLEFSKPNWYSVKIKDPDGNIYDYQEAPLQQGGDTARTVHYPAVPTDVYGSFRSDILKTRHQYISELLVSKRLNGQQYAQFDYLVYANGSGTDSRVKSSQHGAGLMRFDFNYDIPNKTTIVKNPLGGMSTHNFSPNSELLNSRQLPGTYCPEATSGLTRDAINRRIVETDADGIKTETTFDADGNVIRMVEAFGSLQQRVTTFAWQMSPRRLQQVIRPTLTTTYSYGAANRISSVSQTSTASGPNYGVTKTTTYDYLDADGNGIPERIIVDGYLPGRADSVTFNYDSFGNLIREERPSGVL